MPSFVKHFVSYHLDKKRSVYSVLIVIFIIASCFLYWVALKGTRITLDDEFAQREQVVARAGSQSISGFVNLLGKNISLLAEDLSEDGSVAERQKNLNAFMDHWSDTPVSAILYADKNGKVLVEVNTSEPQDLMTSVTDRPFYPWAKTAKPGEYFVGSPIIGTIGEVKGKYIVPVASPVFVDGKFNGLISSAVVLSDLTTTYLNPLKFTDNTRIYLIDETGAVLNSITGTLIGSNYIEYLSKYSYPGQPDALNKLNSALISPTNEGKLQIRLPDSVNVGSFNNYIIAYSKVHVGSSSWFLAIASPQSESDLYLWRVKGAIYGAFVFTLILVVVFAVTNIQADKQRRKSSSN